MNKKVGPCSTVISTESARMKKEYQCCGTGFNWVSGSGSRQKKVPQTAENEEMPCFEELDALSLRAGRP